MGLGVKLVVTRNCSLISNFSILYKENLFMSILIELIKINFKIKSPTNKDIIHSLISELIVCRCAIKYSQPG